MITFINFLRAIAACFITNSHYTGIYPTDLIANGGLVGDVIFFAVSGYCLYNIRYSFGRWYAKRLVRVYTPVVIITAIYIMMGMYSVSAEKPWQYWFVYPTYYHFVASIILLYIPYYFIIKFNKTRENIPKIMMAIAVVWLLIYLCLYDKSYYHIDNVREPMIRFLFMESMLLGAYFRQHDEKYRDRKSTVFAVAAAIVFVVYFASKMIFVKYQSLSGLQFVNQIIIFLLLYFVFSLFAALDSRLRSMPVFIRKTADFLADITLEIYLVQYVIIGVVRGRFLFPINWVILTLSIVISAQILHIVCKPVVRLLSEKLFGNPGGIKS